MRREERNLLHDLCNWKSICRLTAILESTLLASLLIGLISISELIVVQIHSSEVVHLFVSFETDNFGIGDYHLISNSWIKPGSPSALTV